MTDDAARPYRRRVLLNTVSTGAANGWAMVVTLVALPLMLRGLGADAFGTWVLLSTFSAVNGWLSLADLGVSTATTRAVAERESLGDRAGVARTVGSSLVLFALLGTVCLVLMSTVGRQWLPTVFATPAALVADLEFAIVVYALQILADLLAAAATSSLEGLQRVDLSRAVDAARRTGVAAATSAVALAGGGLRGVATASLVVSAVSAGVAAAILWARLPRPRLVADRGTLLELLRHGRAMALVRPFGVIQRMMDRLIVGALLGPAPVALVEIATQIQNGADAVLSASSYAVIPSASWLRARGDGASLRELLHTGTKYSLLVTMPFVTAPALLAVPLVAVWVGPTYSAAAGLAALGLLSVAIGAPLQVGANLLVGTGRAPAVLRAISIAVLANLAASLILVDRYGTIGAFVGTVIGALCLVVPLGRSARREVDSSVGDFVRDAVVPSLLPNVALALAVGAVVAAPLGDLATLAVAAAVGAPTYGVVALRWSMRPGELEALRATVVRSVPKGAPT